MRIEELLAPLAPAEPTDAEIVALLAEADRRQRRRRTRLATGAALATAAATAAFAALPGAGQHPATPTTTEAILTTAAAVAADQPEPAAWTGYRYAQVQELRTQDGYTVERVEETWMSSDWQGRRLSPAGRVVAGSLPSPTPAGERYTPPKLRPGERLSPEELRKMRAALAPAAAELALRPRDIQTPRDMPNMYGDGPLAKVPLDELPTDPQRLANLLLEAHRDGRWTPDGHWNPPPAIADDVLHDILLLLTEANTTPAQRAALITVLTNYDGVKALPAVKDHRGRDGRGVEIPVGARGPVRVIFAPGTSELLEWSAPGDVHTYVRFGHVARLGERP